MKSGRLETQDSLEEIVPKQENILKKIYIYIKVQRMIWLLQIYFSDNYNNKITKYCILEILLTLDQTI